VNFDLLADYNPLPDTAVKPATAKQTTKQGKVPGKSARTPRPARKAARL
jgi:hypothetical protein